MKDYKIIKFEERDGDLIYEYTLNEQHGEYMCNGRDNKGKLDLIGDPNIILTQVDRMVAIQGTRFTLGDELGVNNQPSPIRKIYFKRNKVMFQVITRQANLAETQEIPMATAVKYVAPAPVVAKKAKIKAPIAPARQGNNIFQVIEDRIWESFLEELDYEADEALNGSPIRLEKTKKARRENLHEFLALFFTTWNNEKNTIWADTVVEVDEDNKIQTPPKKKRSLGDIYMICKYYYPQVTLVEVLDQLYTELPAHFERVGTGFRSCVCGQINKRVWWYQQGSPNNVNHKTTNDEFGKPYRWYIENL